MRILSKPVLYVVLPVLMLLPAVGCNGRGDRPEHSQSALPANDSIETPHSKAFRYMGENRPFEELIEQQLLAVKQLREGHPQDDAVQIIAQAGHMYMRHGDYMEALIYLQEANDSLKARAIRDGHPDPGAIRMHGTMSGLLTRVGLFEEALEENARAIEISNAYGYTHAADLWKMRKAIYGYILLNNPENRQNVMDSALYALDMTEKVLPLMPLEADSPLYKKYERELGFSKADLFVTFHEDFNDSIASAKAFLEKDISLGGKNSVSEKVLLGKIYVLQGDNQRGLNMIEEALDAFRKEDDKESVSWALDILADCYLRAGKSEKLAHIYPQLCELRDSLTNVAKINAVIGADFRYKLKETKQETERLAMEKRRATKIAIYEGLALVIGGIAGAFIMWLGLKRMRKVRKEKERQQCKIDEILSHQQMLNATIEDLNMRLNNHESVEVIEKAAISLNPTLLSGEDENEFRRAFNKLYPNFLTRLRTEFPALTPNDELVCMMIYLKAPSIDIALCLGISRASLNSIRYRIRKKLALDKDTDLDTFIRSR